MRPIPRSQLPHTATLMKPTGDGYAAEVLMPVATLTRVYIAQAMAQGLTKDDTPTEQTALLLFDARHSRPKDVQFALGQRVLFGGIVYRVEAIEPLFDRARLHHTEVSLRV